MSRLSPLCSFTNTPLESAALAFLPAAPSREDAQETARLLILLGAASGVIGSAVAVGLPAVAPQLFTANTALWPNMQSVQLQVRSRAVLSADSVGLSI